MFGGVTFERTQRFDLDQLIFAIGSRQDCPDQEHCHDQPAALLDLASDVKRSPDVYRSALAGKSIALLFEKPSLRTRMTFELAIQQLGGFALLEEGPIGAREPLRILDVLRGQAL